MNESRTNAQSHLIPSFTSGRAWQRPDLLVIARGEGCYVYDTDGNAYLDGLAGLSCTNLGHGRRDLSAAAKTQMDTLAFYPTWGGRERAGRPGCDDDRRGSTRRSRRGVLRQFRVRGGGVGAQARPQLSPQSG